MSEFHKVTDVNDILPGEIKAYVVGNISIAICNINGNYYAFKDECSHQEFPLSDGDIEAENVVCMYHGAEFDVKTGEAVCLPAVDPIETFELKIEGDDIYVSVDE